MQPIDTKTTIHLVVVEPACSKGIVADIPRWMAVSVIFGIALSWGGILYFALKLTDEYYR